MGSNVRLSLLRVKTTNDMFKRNYFNPKSAICNNIIFYKFPTFTISFVLCKTFTCNPSGFRKFRYTAQAVCATGAKDDATVRFTIDNLKNIMVITALSNIPDLRQETHFWVVCSSQTHRRFRLHGVLMALRGILSRISQI